MSDKSFSLDTYVEKSLDGQTVGVRLRLNAIVTQLDEFKDHTFVSVDVKGTNVAAARDGKMKHDKKDKRGYFLEGVDLTLRLDSSEYYVGTDSPPTTMNASTITSSSQFTLNLSAGTFGDTPTTNAGGSLTIGSSVSESLQAWRVENLSDDTVIQHQYRMATTEDGARYNQPKDLVDLSGGGQVAGAPLHPVPHISIVNLPLVTTGIFVSRGKQSNDVRLLADVTAHLASVEKTFEVFAVKVKTHTERLSWSFTCPVAISTID
ncbi:hypothetical protein [Micromonospora sp. NPDC000442]|uniref:hypothetical protein n=1 Tax=Micromonospora sp. NPDC000442 TaxID=3364217 RepID=UPI0036AF13FB